MKQKYSCFYAKPIIPVCVENREGDRCRRQWWWVVLCRERLLVKSEYCHDFTERSIPYAERALTVPYGVELIEFMERMAGLAAVPLVYNKLK